MICIDNKGVEEELTIGVDYDILLDLDEDNVLVMNNKMMKFVCHTSRFISEGEVEKT